MQPYWTYTYREINGMDEQKIELYKYLQRHIVLTCSSSFSKGFQSHIREAGGVFNANIAMGDTGIPGWCFSADSQSDLQQLISGISRGDKTPVYDEESESKNIALFQQLQKVIDLIPATSEDYILSETDGMRTFIRFGKEQEGDNCVISLKTSRKNLNVYQIENRR